MQWKHFSAGATRVAAALGAGCVVAAVGIVAASTASATASPTISTSCVAPYALEPSVGATTISWASAPSGAKVEIVGYVTEYRDASPSTGSVLLPGLPLDNAELGKVYKIYLVDTAGATIAGPTGLALCTSPTSTSPTSSTTTSTSPTSSTTTSTSPTSSTTTSTSPTSSTTTSTSPTSSTKTSTSPTSSTKTSTTAAPKTTTAKSPKVVIHTDGGELSNAFGLALLCLGLFGLGLGLFVLYRLARR